MAWHSCTIFFKHFLIENQMFGFSLENFSHNFNFLCSSFLATAGLASRRLFLHVYSAAFLQADTLHARKQVFPCKDIFLSTLWRSLQLELPSIAQKSQHYTKNNGSAPTTIHIYVYILIFGGGVTTSLFPIACLKTEL